MTGKIDRRCTDTISTYFDRVLQYNRTDAGIDAAESRSLFEMADACGPDTSGGDAIQHLYRQITGIPNPDPSLNDLRPTVPGIFVTRFPENDPLFQSTGYFSQKEENACLSFDPAVPRDAFCQDDEEPTRLTPVFIRWQDADNGNVSFHEIARAKIDLTAHGRNWRVAREEWDVDESFDVIRRNLHYPQLVADGMQKIVNRLQDPWDVLQAACDILDTLVAARAIEPATKHYYGEMLTNFFQQRISLLPDPMYQRGFMAHYAESYRSYLLLIRDKSEVADGWRNGFFNGGGGLFLGTTLTLGAFFVAFPALLVAGKMGLAALGVMGAVTVPAWFIPALIAVGAGLLVYGIIYAVSRSRGNDVVEEQYSHKIDRKIPGRPQ